MQVHFTRAETTEIHRALPGPVIALDQRVRELVMLQVRKINTDPWQQHQQHLKSGRVDGCNFCGTSKL